MSYHLQNTHSLKQNSTNLNKQLDSSNNLLKYFIGGDKNTTQSSSTKHLGPKYTLARRISLHLCCRLLLPFTIVDSDAMFDFFRAYNIVKTKEDMPSRKAVSSTALSDIFESFESGIRRFFIQCDAKSISTAYDMWTDGHGHNNYINITVQIIDKLWNLQSINLGTDPLERPHTAVRIERHIEEKLVQFGLQNKINISVKDNGSNVKACARNMAAKTGLDRSQYDDFECFAHNLHLLIMKDVLNDLQHEELRALLKKIKSIHRALVYKLPELKKESIEEQSVEVQNFFLLLDDKISEILETEPGDIEIDVPMDVPRVTSTETFKNSNDTRWDSTRILLKTRRENEGKSLQ